MVRVFKNWKLLFKKICENTCGWKNVLKCVKCYLKTENDGLKTQTKHPLSLQDFTKITSLGNQEKQDHFNDACQKA